VNYPNDAHEPGVQCTSVPARKASLLQVLRKGLVTAALTLSASVPALAQVADFNVTVNTGPNPPNADTVYPGEATSVRITLSNNNTVSSLTGVNFSKALPTTATNGLIVIGASAINGDPGCTGGTLTTSTGASGVSLSGLTVPPRQLGVPGSGECYLDIPIAAFSIDGNGGSLAYSLNAGEVDSDQGTNATGGPQAYTLRPSTRPTWSKSFSPNDIHVLGGATRTMTITINNSDGNVPLSGIAFSDVFPTAGGQGATIEPTGTPAGGSCGGTTLLTQGPTARIDVSGVDLAPSSSCTITVETRARHSAGTYNNTTTNSIPATGFTSDQGLRPSANANSQVRARSPLAVGKSFTPGIVASGQPNTFTVTLTNSGFTPLEITNFTDDPIAAAPNQANMTIANAGDISNSCAGGTATLESGGQGFTVGGFSIPASGNCVITVTYTATTPGADQPSTYTNSIGQGDVQTSTPGIVSQARSATVLVADRLRVLKSAAPANATAGDPVRYTITVQNYSASILNNVSVLDVLPNGATFLTGGVFDPTLTPACGTLGLNGAVQGDSSVNFTIPTQPARTGTNTPGTCVINFSAMLDPDGTTATTNVIPAGNVCFGAVPTCNNVASGGATTNNTATMSLAKTFDNAENVSKIEGLTTRLRLVLTNNSVSALTNATISDTLPSAGPFQQLRVATPANISNSCGGTVTAIAGSTSVALNGGTVPAASGGTAGTCFLEVDVAGPAGSYPNTADATAVRNNADGSTTDVSDSDGANLTYSDALRVEKFFNPTSTGDGGSSTGSVRFTNLDSGSPITGISMTDNLPAGMLIATPSNAYSTCGGNPALTADPGTGTVTLSGATLAPSAVCEVRFDVSVTGNTDWTNTIPAGGVTADNGITNRDPVTAILAFVPPEVPLISKAISPGNVAPGQPGLLTITVTNAAQDLSNLELTDYFTVDGTAGAALNGMRLAAAPTPSTNCPNGIVTAMPGDTSVRLSGASLPANASCQVRVNVTSTTAGTITNTIPVNSISNDQGATNSTSFAQSTLNIGTAIGVGKMFEPAVVSPTEPSRLRITIYNTQSEGLTGLSLTDTFPAGLVTATDPRGFSDCGGGVAIAFPTADSVAMTGGAIDGATDGEAATCVIEADVVAATEGTYLNSIPANSLLANGTPVPHPEANATLEVRERLIVNKAFDDLTLDAGDPNGFTTGTASRLPGVAAPLTIRIENPNTIALTEVRFVDQLPDGLTLAPAPALATTCSGGAVDGDAFGREIRLTGATLDAAAVCTVTANVVSNIPGIYTNEIAVGEVTSFEGIDNNPLTQAQIIVITPPGVTKDIAPPVIAPGVPATLTLALENDNDLAYTLTAPLVDNLPGSPGQMTVADPSVVTTTCPDGTGIVTAVANASSISIADGASVPPGGCVVTVEVTAATPGDYLNFIPVGALNTSFGPSEEPAQAPLLVSTLGYISGRVFLDNQTVPNGQYLPGSSTPIEGNPIELRSGADCNGALLTSATTDAMGNYLFSGLAAGTYSVCQPTQPGGSLNSVTTEGSIVTVAGSTGSAGSASNPGTPTSQIVGIVLNNNGNADEVSGSPENNFSEVLPASIAGNVYHDANNNGIFDPGESGIGGVAVTLSGPVNTSVFTNPDGSYNFSGLPPGQYTVVETQPSPWTDGIDTLGTVAGIPNGNATTNDTFTAITLAPGDAGIEYNFGEVVGAAALAINATGTCSSDAPGASYDIPAYSGSSTTFTLSWYTVDDRLVATYLNQPASGSLLWPGVVVDSAGMGVDWPGWVFTDGQWVAVPDDRLPDMVLRVTLGETAETTVTYPRNSLSCLTQPQGTFTTPIPALPNPALLLLALLMATAAGWPLARARLRRRF
jgi:uncharacterized repeat protein (TIGR01451 family)